MTKAEMFFKTPQKMRLVWNSNRAVRWLVYVLFVLAIYRIHQMHVMASHLPIGF